MRNRGVNRVRIICYSSCFGIRLGVCGRQKALNKESKVLCLWYWKANPARNPEPGALNIPYLEVHGGVISPLICVITIVDLLITPFITTHEPPSTPQL